MFSKGKGEPGESVSASTSGKQSGVPSIVSPDLTVTGNLVSAGDIQVDGRVDGDVDAANLTIGENGIIQGTVRAETVHVCGGINGELHAASVTLAATARIQGDIVHETLAIEAGAYLDGHCRRQNASHQGHEPASKRAAAAPSAGGSRGGGGQTKRDAPEPASAVNDSANQARVTGAAGSADGAAGTERGQ